MRKQALPVNKQPHSAVGTKEIVKLQVKGVRGALVPTSLSIDLVLYVAGGRQAREYATPVDEINPNMKAMSPSITSAINQPASVSRAPNMDLAL